MKQRTLSIDPEFRDLIPPLTDEEFKQLRENIIEDCEVREPIVTWNGIILDGHNRWAIIQENPDIPYKTMEMIFASRNEAKAWMIRNQLGRRNLPNYERSRLALQLKEAIAAEAKANQATHTEQGYQKSDKAVDTNKELAKIAGVSHDTIHKVDVIEQKATPAVKEQLRRGEMSINKAYNEVKRKESHSDNAEGENTRVIVKYRESSSDGAPKLTFKLQEQSKNNRIDCAFKCPVDLYDAICKVSNATGEEPEQLILRLVMQYLHHDVECLGTGLFPYNGKYNIRTIKGLAAAVLKATGFEADPYLLRGDPMTDEVREIVLSKQDKNRRLLLPQIGNCKE